VKLIFGKTGTLIGGTVMAPNAGIIAQELALGVRYEMSATEISSVPHAANDWSELIRTAAERIK
jgi:pyruvate/2-oxoglutarate dehydrogenase complex dihydrolipoamide dehydrogenase (E3) component